MTPTLGHCRLCDVGVSASPRVTEPKAGLLTCCLHLGSRAWAWPTGSAEALIVPTPCLGLEWRPMGRAGPASSRHQKPPAAQSQTSRCSPWYPTCSMSRLSTPGASAAASCPLSQSTSVSGGSGVGCGGPLACSCSSPSLSTSPPPPPPPPPASTCHPVLSSIMEPAGSIFIMNQESAHFLPSCASIWSSLIISHVDQCSPLHPHFRHPPSSPIVCFPHSRHQRATVSTRLRPCIALPQLAQPAAATRGRV